MIQYQYGMEPWQLNEDNDGQEQPLGLGAPSLVGLSGRKKEKRGWAKKHQGKIREVSKYVQVFCSLFFFFFTMKDSRLEDLWIVTVCFARRGRSWATEGGCRRHLWGGQQTRPEVCWTKTCHLGRFSLAALTFWIYNTFFTKCSKSQWSWILTYLPLKCLFLSLL